MSAGRERRILTTVVSREDAGQQLDEWLAGRFTYRDRANWIDEIERGRVVVNDDVPDACRVLTFEDVIVWTPVVRPEPEVDFNCSVVYEDERIIAVNKSGNLPCHPAGIYFKNTLSAWLEERGYPAYLANRVDRETSGLVLVAQNAAVAKEMTKIFEQRLITKTYFAVVHGCLEKSIHAVGALAPDTESRVRKKRRFIPNGTDGELAESAVEAVSVSATHSLVAVTPKTGRLHQIRATLLAYGFPIVGDKLYGLDDTFFLRFIEGELTDEDRQRLVLDRQALHAWKLSFPFGDSERVDLMAPLAPDLVALCGQLGLTVPSN